MIQSILSNLAIILLGHLVMSMIISQEKRLSRKFMNTIVILLFSAVIITMFYLPINIDGFIFDLRAIPLIFLAAFRGWKITLSTLVIVCTWRYFMGGIGTIPGIIAGLIGPTLFALFFFSRKKAKDTILQKIIVITICWFISDFPIVFIIPNGWEIFKGFFFIRYTSFLIVGFIYYAFIKAEHKKQFYRMQLERMAWHDPLTGLLNRRKFVELVEEQLNNSHSNKQRYIALIDIDYFKQVNDTYGHLAGDYVLKHLAEIFKSQQNHHMLLARYGGEEFIMYLEANSLDDAVNILEQLREQINSTPFKIINELKIQLTISIGFAKLQNASTLKETISLADQHLYIAKANGRNQIIPKL